MSSQLGILKRPIGSVMEKKVSKVEKDDELVVVETKLSSIDTKQLVHTILPLDSAEPSSKNGLQEYVGSRGLKPISAIVRQFFSWNVEAEGAFASQSMSVGPTGTAMQNMGAVYNECRLDSFTLTVDNISLLTSYTSSFAVYDPTGTMTSFGTIITMARHSTFWWIRPTAGKTLFTRRFKCSKPVDVTSTPISPITEWVPVSKVTAGSITWGNVWLADWYGGSGATEPVTATKPVLVTFHFQFRYRN